MEQPQQIKELFDEEFRFRVEGPSPLHNYVAAQIVDRLADLKDKPQPFYEQTAHPSVLSALLKENGYEEGDAPYGLIASGLKLQSMNNKAAYLKAFYTNLKKEGVFMGALLCGDTLHEMKSCLIEAEIEISHGIHPRILPMIDRLSISQLLLQAGFTHPVLDHERVVLTYPDLWALMRALRSMGLSNNLKERTRHFTRRSLFEKANELYKAKYSTNKGGIRATFDILFLHGWKEE